jgi:hypothetical protein
MRVSGTFLMCLAVLFLAGCDSDGGDGADSGADSGTECLGPEDCDDGVECTGDRCVGGQCRHTPDNEICGDGDMCNGQERCDPFRGGCTEGDPLVCDDGIVCTADRCDPDHQRCVTDPDDDLCDDGFTCDPDRGGCVPG